MKFAVSVLCILTTLHSSCAFSPNIVELATSVKDLSTLVTAVKAAALVETLEGAGPFTVFAPTNEAFESLPKATLEHLLEPKNIKELQAVLEYHVLSSAVHSTDLHRFQKVKSIEGDELSIVRHNSDVYVDGAKVLKADVDASNGVVHIIDKVLIPYHTERTLEVLASENIVELAASVKDLSTLVTAVKAAALVKTLEGPGPFTVFAPTNEAFSALPKETLDHLLEPENAKELQAVLEYHVVSGDIHSSDLHRAFLKSVEGEELSIIRHESDVFVNGAKVTTADADASNGVVHIIDKVLLPPHLATKNIVELASETKDLSTLVTALKAANLTTALSGSGPFTVFAPSNEAFERIPEYLLKRLLEPKNVHELVKVLTYHVLPEAVHSSDLKEYQHVKTLEGSEVSVVKYGDVVEVNNAKVTTANIDATNGVVHIIDHVLLPHLFLSLRGMKK